MNKILFSLIAFILMACSPQVTVTSEVTVTLAPPTPTPAPTLAPTEESPTSEPEATEEVQISYDIENPENATVKIEGNVSMDINNKEIGPLSFSVTIITDDALRDRGGTDIEEVKANWIYQNPERNNETAEDAISTALVMAFYECWKNNVIDPTLKAERANISFEEYVQMLSDAEKSGDHSAILYNVLANDMNLNNRVYTEEYIEGVDPFYTNIVVINPDTNEAAKNMSIIENKNKKRISSFGTNVYTIVNDDGESISTAYIFIPGVSMANGNPILTARELAGALTRMYTSDYDDQLRKTVGDYIIDEAFLDVLTYYSEEYGGEMQAIVPILEGQN